MPAPQMIRRRTCLRWLAVFNIGTQDILVLISGAHQACNGSSEAHIGEDGNHPLNAESDGIDGEVGFGHQAKQQQSGCRVEQLDGALTTHKGGQLLPDSGDFAEIHDLLRSNLADDMGRDTNRNRQGRNVFGYHRASADNAASSNANAWKNDCAGTQPAILFDGYGHLDPAAAGRDLFRMCDCRNRATR